MSTIKKPKCVSVVIPSDEWQDLRLLAVHRRCSASAIVRSLVRGHLAMSGPEVRRARERAASTT